MVIAIGPTMPALSPVEYLGIEALRVGVPRWHAALEEGKRHAPKCDFIPSRRVPLPQHLNPRSPQAQASGPPLSPPHAAERLGQDRSPPPTPRSDAGLISQCDPPG